MAEGKEERAEEAAGEGGAPCCGEIRVERAALEVDEGEQGGEDDGACVARGGAA